MSTTPEGSLPTLPVFAAEAQVCGNCKLWRPHSVDHRGWVGPCRVQDNRGLFPPSAPVCNAYVPKTGAAAPAPVPGRLPARTPRNVLATPPLVVRQRPNPDATVDLGDLQMTRQELIDLIREAVQTDAEPPALAPKWEGGTLQLVPGKSDLQAKELPIDALFHKVVMVRDRLRVLEQKLNAHPKLSDAEKVELQGYVTRVYGSLTSFNHLFRDKSDHFVGAKGDE
jgi:hypothetical protein